MCLLIKHRFLPDIKPIRCLDLGRAQQRVRFLDFEFVQNNGFVTHSQEIKDFLLALGCINDVDNHFIVSDRVQIAALFERFPDSGVYEIVQDTKKGRS